MSLFCESKQKKRETGIRRLILPNFIGAIQPYVPLGAAFVGILSFGYPDLYSFCCWDTSERYKVRVLRVICFFSAL